MEVRLTAATAEARFYETNIRSAAVRFAQKLNGSFRWNKQANTYTITIK